MSRLIGASASANLCTWEFNMATWVSWLWTRCLHAHHRTFVVHVSQGVYFHFVLSFHLKVALHMFNQHNIRTNLLSLILAGCLQNALQMGRVSKCKLREQDRQTDNSVIIPLSTCIVTSSHYTRLSQMFFVTFSGHWEFRHIGRWDKFDMCLSLCLPHNIKHNKFCFFWVTSHTWIE